MGGAQGDDLPLEDPQKRGTERSFCRCCCCRGDQGIRHQRLATVATSRLVSLKALLGIRVTLLLLLVFGAGWLGWRSSSDDRIDEEPPSFLCWPDWSYVLCTVYFMVRERKGGRASTKRSKMAHKQSRDMLYVELT